jgi:hypothetical protein
MYNELVQSLLPRITDGKYLFERDNMNLPDLKGSPKQVNWASKIRADRLKVWSESSSERFGEIEGTLATMTDAGWWISYKDKDINTVYNHLHQGVDLQKTHREAWLKQEKKQEQKDSSEVRAYLKKELVKESSGNSSKLPLKVSVGEGLMKWESQTIDTRTGKVSCDPNLPF